MLDNIFHKSILHHGRRTEATPLCSLSGEVRIGILGGSVSCGARANVGFAIRLSSWHTSYQQTRYNISVVNGAIPATGVAPVTACLNSLIGDVDIIVFEFSINEWNATETDSFISILTNLKNRPVLIALDVFSDLVGGPTRNSTEVFISVPTAMAIKYDISVISMSSALYPEYYGIVEPFTRNKMFNDLTTQNGQQHINDVGHDIVAYVLHRYITSSLMLKNCTREPMSIKDTCMYKQNVLTCLPQQNWVKPIIPLWNSGINLSQWWTHDNKHFLSTISSNSTVLGKSITFKIEVHHFCFLRIMVLTCGPVNYCLNGGFKLWYDNKFIGQYEPIIPLAHAVSVPYGGAYVAPGTHEVKVTPSLQKTVSGSHSVKLSGLFCTPISQHSHGRAVQ